MTILLEFLYKVARTKITDICVKTLLYDGDLQCHFAEVLDGIHQELRSDPDAATEVCDHIQSEWDKAIETDDGVHPDLTPELLFTSLHATTSHLFQVLQVDAIPDPPQIVEWEPEDWEADTA